MTYQPRPTAGQKRVLQAAADGRLRRHESVLRKFHKPFIDGDNKPVSSRTVQIGFDVGAEHYRYCPGCNPVMGHAAFVFAYVVAAISGAIVAALAMAVAVWAGWIG